MSHLIRTHILKSIGRASLVSTIIFLIFSSTNLIAQSRVRTATFAAEWNVIDQSKSYREDWRGLDKSYTQILRDATTDITVGNSTDSPSNLLISLIQDVRNDLSTELAKPTEEQSTSAINELKWIIQEAGNELITIQALLGNDQLIKGLRVRFPGAGDPDDPDQLTLLSWSEESFEKAYQALVEEILSNEVILRKSGTVNPSFPIFVENAALSVGTSGETIENEYFRLTNLIERKAMAGSSKGKRMYFFGNVDDVDNYPYGNFPGPEDQDFNGDGIENQSGRDDAARQLQAVAHETWVSSLLLAANQNKAEFERNNGGQLKRHVVDAQRVFDDIHNGFNPLELLGDFVPYQPVENFISLAKSRVQDAVTSEEAAKAANRAYDNDQTALTQTLQSQRERYVDAISAMTALDITAYDVLNMETREAERDRFLQKVNEQILKGKGSLGIQYLNIQDINASLEQQRALLEQVAERRSIENERFLKNVSINNSASSRLQDIAISQAIINSFSKSVSTGVVGGEPSYTVSVAFNPDAQLIGTLQAAEIRTRNIQQNGILSTQNQAALRSLGIEEVNYALAIERGIQQAKLEIAKSEEQRAELTRTLNNYIAANDDLVDAYFNNPAYRLDRDQLVEAAETSFETAMVTLYYAAKALEYQWSERFSNPIPRLDGNLPQSLPSAYDPYVRAESIFAVKFAHLKAPNLSDYLSALQAWDLNMRQMRAPAQQGGNVYLSLKYDLLGFDEDNPNQALLRFQDLVQSSRVDGENGEEDDLILEFSMNMGDESIFPAHPNLKIKEIRANLVSTSGNSLRSQAGSEPALIDLVMLDEAVVRSFYSEYPDQDDFITYRLEAARTIERSPFIASVESTIDNYSYPAAAPNLQLQGHSPGASRWVLRIKMNRRQNEDLNLNYLSDVELVINYDFGKPRNIQF